ncbi:hypothetical protein [Devosia rhizoryzae]|uniref:Uncharacterized protein n=1 Tax=Devosia rhizoryzae TaxID=2774137 RepID=A0ABX7C6S5_9HYPH|nr:hypothetical protein [Devosia rhizoryzae]QQR39908.1 hypothetical protein JI748_02515 [Devosia rhizoryzae]
MPPRRTPITRRQYRDYMHVRETLADLRIELRCHLAGESFGGIEAVLARRFMADAARLVAREPGGRSLYRLPATGDIPREAMHAALHDVGIALAAFVRAHYDYEPDELWIEGEETGWSADPT